MKEILELRALYNAAYKEWNEYVSKADPDPIVEKVLGEWLDLKYEIMHRAEREYKNV